MRPGPVVGFGAFIGVLLSLLASLLPRDHALPLSVVTPAMVSQPFAPRTVYGSAVEGRLVDISGTRLTLEDALGTHSVEVSATTELTRGVDHVSVMNRNVSRLRLGDWLWIAANPTDGGALEAGRITANAFIGRDGIIVAAGDNFLDVRLRTARLSNEFFETAAHFIIDPAVRIESRAGNGVDALTAGRNVSIQGFIADDGTLVALYLWPYDR